MVKNPFILETTLVATVVPATKNQFGSIDEDIALTNTIARCVAEELAYSDVERQGRYDWLPEMFKKKQEQWDWLEMCLSQNRELVPVSPEHFS